MAHHGVELMQRGDDGLDVLHGLALGLGQQLDVLFLGGNELVQRGIQEADVDVAARRGPHNSCSKSPCCMGSSMARAALRCSTVSEQIISRIAAMRSGSKNMCSVTAQADALGAEGHSQLGVAGGVGVGADLQLTVLVRELQ